MTKVYRIQWADITGGKIKKSFPTQAEAEQELKYICRRPFRVAPVIEEVELSDPLRSKIKNENYEK